MHPAFLDRYSRLRSPVHRLPAEVKAGAGAALIAVVVLAPVTWVVPHCVAAVIVMSALVLSRVPVWHVVKRLLVVEPFIVIIASLSLLQPDGGAKFVSVVVKSALSLFTVLVVSNTTPFSSLLSVLRSARVPDIVVTILALMYRYLFVLIDEMQSMERARASRTFSRAAALRWDVRAGVLGQLFLRSTERAERIFAAMSARGWK